MVFLLKRVTKHKVQFGFPALQGLPSSFGFLRDFFVKFTPRTTQINESPVEIFVTLFFKVLLLLLRLTIINISNQNKDRENVFKTMGTDLEETQDGNTHFLSHRVLCPFTIPPHYHLVYWRWFSHTDKHAHMRYQTLTDIGNGVFDSVH